MSLLSRVEIAMSNAPTRLASEVPTSAVLASPEDGDDTPLYLNKDTPADAPNEVTLNAGDNTIIRLLGAYEAVFGGWLPEGYKESSQQHENQHLQAARILSTPRYLGIVSARMGIKVESWEQPQGGFELMVVPYVVLDNYRTTKLGMALIEGYPLVPSEGDINAVISSGYSGVDELAEIAMRRNRNKHPDSTTPLYPVPLGAGSGQGLIPLHN